MSDMTTTIEQRFAEISKSDVMPLNLDGAFKSLTPEEQQEIITLADKIDVTKYENAMKYAEEALRKTFEQCGQFLKSESGSKADQEVIKRVAELSKKASDSYEDFELVLQEPNFIEKIFLKLSKAKRNERTKKIQNHAVTNYKLLCELKESCEIWLDMLRKAMSDITYSELNDSDNLIKLEKYIIAGYMAKQRVEEEMQQLQSESKSTGLRTVSQKYDAIKEGYDIFVLRLNYLEKSRVMYYLSIGQLKLIERSNRNVQISVHTQSDNCMALISQQLRNAVLNAKNQEVIEGQQMLTRLSDELIKDVSSSIGKTAMEAERILYYGMYNTEAAKEAVKTVIASCDSIKHVAEEMLPKMRADVMELNTLVEELRPYVDKSAENVKPQDNSSVPITTGAESSLKF